MASLKYIADVNLMTVTLASAYTAADGHMHLTSGHGARLPSSGDFWIRTTSGTYQCFKVTVRSTDDITVTPAQDGTSDGNLDTGAELKWVLGVAALTQLILDITNNPTPSSVIISPTVDPGTVSYSNTGGTGDRSSSITVTTSGTDPHWNAATTINGATNIGYIKQEDNSARWICYEFSVPSLIVEIKIYSANANGLSQGIWKLQGSTDGSNWVDRSNEFEIKATGSTDTYAAYTTAQAYRYWRLYCVSGSGHDPGYWGTTFTEIDFKITSVSPDVLTLSNPGKTQFDGDFTVAGATRTTPCKVGLTSALPSTCEVGEIYFATDALAGKNLYFATAPNTWTQMN